MYRNKFCVGEEVEVKGVITNAFDIACTEVIAAKYFRIGEWMTATHQCRNEGWKYKTSHMVELCNHGWFLEASLQKLPPKNDPWADCYFSPKHTPNDECREWAN